MLRRRAATTPAAAAIAMIAVATNSPALAVEPDRRWRSRRHRTRRGRGVVADHDRARHTRVVVAVVGVDALGAERVRERVPRAELLDIAPSHARIGDGMVVPVVVRPLDRVPGLHVQDRRREAHAGERDVRPLSVGHGGDADAHPSEAGAISRPPPRKAAVDSTDTSLMTPRMVDLLGRRHAS